MENKKRKTSGSSARKYKETSGVNRNGKREEMSGANRNGKREETGSSARKNFRDSSFGGAGKSRTSSAAYGKGSARAENTAKRAAPLRDKLGKTKPRNENKRSDPFEIANGRQENAPTSGDERCELNAGALLAPLPPAIVTVSDGERDNLLTVGWCGIISTIPPRTYVSIRPQRYSHGILKRGREFVVNIPTADMARAVDLVGIYTGAKMDKFEAAGLRRIPSKSVTPPTVAGCPIALECKVIEIYESGTHDVFVADIVNVTCQKELLDGEGKLHYENANLLAYAHGEYYKLGERVGRFGFSTDKENRPTKGRRADDR